MKELYDAIKDELSTIISWYTDPNIDSSVRLPRGVLLTGAPGLGKTLFMRAVKEAAPLPVYTFVGNGERDITPGLIQLFEAASEEPNGAVFLIDELDSILDSSCRVEHCLKELMDGLKPQNRVLFIASANKSFRGNNPLLRPGRFDRVIRFSYPDRHERADIIRYYLDRQGRTLGSDVLGYISELTDGCSNAELAAIVSDACLRNRDSEITEEMLECSHALINYAELPKEVSEGELSLITCVHEIGHAILIDRYREHYKLHRITVNKKYNQCGTCFCTIDNDTGKTLDFYLESIDIGLAGFMATNILLGVKDSGSASDLQDARTEARRLVNSFGYNGVDKVLREYVSGRRNESWVTCLRNERLAGKIIRRCERRVEGIIKANKNVILRLAKELQQVGSLSGRRVRKVLSEEQSANARKKHA